MLSPARTNWPIDSGCRQGDRQQPQLAIHALHRSRTGPRLTSTPPNHARTLVAFAAVGACLRRQRRGCWARRARLARAGAGRESATGDAKSWLEKLKVSWLGERDVRVAFDSVSWTPAVLGAAETGKTDVKPVLEDSTWNVQGTVKEFRPRGNVEAPKKKIKKVEKVGLIGANGAGKSAQLQMILEGIEPTSGTVKKSPADLQIGYMQQEADLDSDQTVREILSAVFEDRSLQEIDADIEMVAMQDYDEVQDKLDDLVQERLDVEEHNAEVDDLIDKLGLAAWEDRLAKEMSGGQQMRVALGSLMLSRPDLLLLDEPTNHIDIETVEFMELFLQAQDIPMVIVSHDRYFLNAVCNKIVEIRDGSTRTYRGNYVRFLQRRDRQLVKEWNQWIEYQQKMASLQKQIIKMQERMLEKQAKQKRQELLALQESPVPKPKVTIVQGFRFPYQAGTSSSPDMDLEAAEQEDMVEVPEEQEDMVEVPEEQEDMVEVPEEQEDMVEVPKEQEDMVEAEVVTADSSDVEDDTLLSTNDLHVSFGDKKVLNGVSFSLKAGEKVAIVGPNGCGKSTLVRAIVDDLPSIARVQGDIETSGSIAYFPQRLAECLNTETGSVKDALYFSCLHEELEAAGGIDRVLKRLQLKGITEEQPVCTLSGGEKARVAFAKFLLRPCSLLLLDEPTNHLDIPTRELLEDALKAFDGAVLVVSHDRFFLREFAGRVLEIVEGGQARLHDSWESYEQHAPQQWHDFQEAEEEFIMQDATAKELWSRKRMARLAKREKHTGLRRLSKKADAQFEILKQQKRRGRQKGSVRDKLTERGIDPIFG